jgi:uncharacterized protein DUF3617
MSREGIMLREECPLRRATVRLGAALVIGAGLIGASAADGLSPGEWKITETIIMNGSKTPTQERTRCYTPEQAADLEKTFTPEYRTTNSACERAEFKSTSTALSWRMLCKGQLDMDVSGNFIFDNPKHYTATIISKGAMAGREFVNTSVAIEAELIGSCQ